MIGFLQYLTPEMKRKVKEHFIIAPTIIIVYTKNHVHAKYIIMTRTSIHCTDENYHVINI